MAPLARSVPAPAGSAPLLSSRLRRRGAPSPLAGLFPLPLRRERPAAASSLSRRRCRDTRRRDAGWWLPLHPRPSPLSPPRAWVGRVRSVLGSDSGTRRGSDRQAAAARFSWASIKGAARGVIGVVLVAGDARLRSLGKPAAVPGGWRGRGGRGPAQAVGARFPAKRRGSGLSSCRLRS